LLYDVETGLKYLKLYDSLPPLQVQRPYGWILLEALGANPSCSQSNQPLETEGTIASMHLGMTQRHCGHILPSSSRVLRA